MRNTYFYMIALALFFFGPSVLAGKTQLDIEVENAVYTIHTKLEGLITYETKEEQQTFAIKIPPKKDLSATNTLLKETIFIEPMVKKIMLSLVNDEKVDHEDDLEPTLLALTEFSPINPDLKSFKLLLNNGDDEMKIIISNIQ